MVPSFLSLENPLSDSYTFIRTLTRLTTTSLLNVLVAIIGSILEHTGFACVTAPIHLRLCCVEARINNFSVMSGRSHRFLGN